LKKGEYFSRQSQWKFHETKRQKEKTRRNQACVKVVKGKKGEKRGKKKLPVSKEGRLRRQGIASLGKDVRD